MIANVRKGVSLLIALILLAGCAATGSTSAVEEGESEGQSESGQSGGADSKLPDGVYKYGKKVKFEDGSTITASKPVAFKRDEYAIGGEEFKKFVKVQLTFRNGSDEVFDPTLTSTSLSSGDVEGDSVFQTGLDSPTNKLLPGKTVKWWVGYGVKSPKKSTLTVNVGFLDYPDVIFTNEA